MNNELTVGVLEDKLRNYHKGTKVHLSCGCCHRSISGAESILQILDKTNQTYGYIELELNAKSKGRVELNEDEKEYYEGEIKKLEGEIKSLNKIIEVYKEEIENINSVSNRIKRRISYLR